MPAELSPILQRFAERTPIPVMARGVLERCLNAQQLDAWFATVAEEQYTRTLLFSTIFDLMTQVVFRHQRSIHAAYQGAVEPIGVSVSSVYNKLNGIEPRTTAALVSYSARQASALIEALGEQGESLLGTRRVKMLDGNCLSAREHRLAETRDVSAAPLPGKGLVVFDPALGVITDLFPCEDAYTQERALLSSVLEVISAGELWIADRNFCTTGFFEGLAERQALALIREHGQLRFEPLGAMGERQRCATGWVSEQGVQLMTGGQKGIVLRRIGIELDVPTRDGERWLYLLTTLPAEEASAVTLAELYRQRWTIEKAFLHLTVELRCEIDTLGYPRAALFGLAVAMVAFNVLAVVKAALGAVHGRETVTEQVSGYYLANEMANMSESLNTVIDPEDWAALSALSLALMAAWLKQLAERAELRKYRKHPRGPKKPPPKRAYDASRPHVSTARVLAQRKKKSP